MRIETTVRAEGPVHSSGGECNAVFSTLTPYRRARPKNQHGVTRSYAIEPRRATGSGAGWRYFSQTIPCSRNLMGVAFVAEATQQKPPRTPPP